MRSSFIAALLACCYLFLTPAAAAEKDVGIVLLHGKWDRPPSKVLGLARQLEAQGYQVLTPTMPWSGTREYDVPYSQAIVEIESAANSLRDKGAKHVIVGGLSFGANAALAYAGIGKPVDAIFLLSPGHTPYAGSMKTALQDSVAKASEMMKSGAANDRAWFKDLNQGQSQQIRVTAASYFSYFDPEGLAAMPKTAAGISSAIPVFMAVGSADQMSGFAEKTIFSVAPPHAKSSFTIMNADHIGLVNVVAPGLIEWLRSLNL